MHSRTIEIKPYINWLQFQRIARHRISYLEYGDPDNSNVIICAHGLTRNAHDFDKIAAVLQTSFRVISISYPGRGESDYFTNKNHYNYQVYVKDTLFFFKHLNIHKPLWLGTSMGGLIGMSIAARRPQVFKGLILNDIGPFIPGSTLVRISKYAEQTPSFNDLTTAKQHLKMIYAQFGVVSEEDWDYMTKHSVKLNTEGQYQMVYDPALIRGMQVNSNNPKDVKIWPLWHRISCPLMVVHGAKSDILQPDTIEEMKRTKNFELYTVDYAGHAPALMSHDQIEPIRLWLERFV